MAQTTPAQKRANDKWRQAHKPEISARMKKYHQQNKDRILAYKKEWHRNNQEESKAKCKLYYLNNRESELENRKMYFAKNENKIKERIYRRRKNIRKAWLIIIKAKGMDICSQCNYSECFASIDFHHPNPKRKEMNIAQVLKGKPTPERIIKLDECISLCANCHRKLHFEENNEEE